MVSNVDEQVCHTSHFRFAPNTTSDFLALNSQPLIFCSILLMSKYLYDILSFPVVNQVTFRHYQFDDSETSSQGQKKTASQSSLLPSTSFTFSSQIARLPSSIIRMDILERARLFKEEQRAKAALATSQQSNGGTRSTAPPSTITSNPLPPGIPIPATHSQSQSQGAPSVEGAIDVEALRAAHKAKLAALEESRKQRSGLKSGGGSYAPPHKAVAVPAPSPLPVVAPIPTPVPRAPVSTSLPPRVTPPATSYVKAAPLQSVSRLYAALPLRTAVSPALPKAPTAPAAPFSLVAALPPVPAPTAKPLSMIEQLDKNQAEFESNLANKEKQLQEIARVEKLETDLKKVQEQHSTVLQEVYKLRAEKDSADEEASERKDRIRQLQHSNDGLRYQLNELERKTEKGTAVVEEGKVKTPLTWNSSTLEEAYKALDILEGVDDNKVSLLIDLGQNSSDQSCVFSLRRCSQRTKQLR